MSRYENTLNHTQIHTHIPDNYFILFAPLNRMAVKISVCFFSFIFSIESDDKLFHVFLFLFFCSHSLSPAIMRFSCSYCSVSRYYSKYIESLKRKKKGEHKVPQKYPMILMTQLWVRIVTDKKKEISHKSCTNYLFYVFNERPATLLLIQNTHTFQFISIFRLMATK